MLSPASRVGEDSTEKHLLQTQRMIRRSKHSIPLRQRGEPRTWIPLRRLNRLPIDEKTEARSARITFHEIDPMRRLRVTQAARIFLVKINDPAKARSAVVSFACPQIRADMQSLEIDITV